MIDLATKEADCLPRTRWLTVKEAAEWLGVSVSTVYLLATPEGGLPHYRVGAKKGKILFDAADLQAFREEQRVETPAAKAKRKAGTGTFRHIDPKKSGSARLAATSSASS